jgi:hypothetical protein
MTLNCSLFTLITYSMSLDDTNIGLLDRINIAHCASERARMYVCDNERFTNEYQTVRMWSRYKCYISTKCSFVEVD